MQISIDQLMWSPKTNTLSTEASDLGLRPGFLPTTVQVTGKTATHTFHSPEATTDSENDILLWTFKADRTSVRLVIFND